MCVCKESLSIGKSAIQIKCISISIIMTFMACYLHVLFVTGSHDQADFSCCGMSGHINDFLHCIWKHSEGNKYGSTEPINITSSQWWKAWSNRWILCTTINHIAATTNVSQTEKPEGPSLQYIPQPVLQLWLCLPVTKSNLILTSFFCSIVVLSAHKLE